MSDKVGPTTRPIPNDWHIASLKSVSLTGAKNGFFKKPELVGSGYKLVNVSELYQPYGIDTRLESVERVDATPSDLAKYGVEEGDIFFTRSSLVLSGIAASNIVRCVWEPTLFECHVMKMSPDQNRVSPEFIAYCCRDPYSRSYLMSQAKQTTMTTISQPEIEQLPVPVAPLKEQQKIARILTTLDNLIEKTEALIAKYQAIKQGMMHDLFTRGVDSSGQLRPTHKQAPDLYKPSELGFIPKEWEGKRLGEKLNEVEGRLQTGPFGSQLHSYEYVTEGVPVIMPQEINNGGVETETIARITPQKALQMRRHWVDSNDIVFSRRGELCRSAAIGERESGWVCGTGCFLLRVSKKAIDAEWLSHLYRHPFIQCHGAPKTSHRRALENQPL